MFEELLVEYTIPYPMSVTITQQPGRRNQLLILIIKEDKVTESVFNFYESERVYMYGDSKMLAIGVAKKEQEPTTIKKKLLNMVANFKRGFKNAG